MPRVRPIGPGELPPAAAATYAAFTTYGPFADQAAVLAVELTLRTFLAGFYNRFNDALQIDDGHAATLAATKETAR